jgi:hypothetical protein
MSQQAELIWVRYDKENGASHHYLLLYLGEHDNKTAALIADSVPDHEIAILRTNLPSIRTMNLANIGAFIKEGMPISYKKAYRHFRTDRMTIQKTYGLSTLQRKQT